MLDELAPWRRDSNEMASGKPSAVQGALAIHADPHAAPISRAVNSQLVNCEHWTPFCLSSGDTCGVDLLLALHDEGEDLAGQVALERTDGVEFGMPLGDAASDVILRLLVGAQSPDGDDVQGAVGCAIAATVQAMSDRLTGRCGNRTDAAEGGEAGF